jgi:hypothetical protein
MKKSIILKLIKEELHKEIKVNNPPQTYVVNSPEYKKFYQFVELCNYWGTDVNSNGNIRFPLNDFDFFYALYSTSLSEHWTPERCIVTVEDLDTVIENYGLEEKWKIKELKDKLKEHSI